MYISELSLWNFRKFKEIEDDNGDVYPGLKIRFQQGLNLLVGENDSGKTAIIDALRILLNTKSSEYVRLVPDDFYSESTNLKLECRIYFNDEEAEEKDKTVSQFIEYLTHDDEGEPFLKISINAERDKLSIKRRFGDKGLISADEDRLDLLKTVYLRPLRDATAMLKPGFKSRVSDVLSALSEFRENPEDNDLDGDTAKQLKELFSSLKGDIEKYLSEGEDSPNNIIQTSLDELLLNGVELSQHAKFSPRIQDNNISSILALFELLFDKEDYKLPGLGHTNVLVIALELMLLSEGQEFPFKRLRSCLIEELEAHLHPQLQLNIVNHLESSERPQIISSTHSPNLASHASLDSVVYIKNTKAFNVGTNSLLSPKDKEYLERFLDVTKANIFFARALIVTEGYSDAVLINSLAKALGRDLVSNGISIVAASIRGDGLMRFARLFLSNDEDIAPELRMSLVGDKDVETISESPLYKSYKNTIKGSDRYRIGCFLTKEKNLEAGYFSEKENLLRLIPKDSQLYNKLGQSNNLDEFLHNIKKSKTIVADELAAHISTDTADLVELDCFMHLIEAIEFVLPKE